MNTKASHRGLHKLHSDPKPGLKPHEMTQHSRVGLPPHKDIWDVCGNSVKSFQSAVIKYCNKIFRGSSAARHLAQGSAVAVAQCPQHPAKPCPGMWPCPCGDRREAR